MSIPYRKTTQEELDLILEEGEGYTLEFKQSINSDLQALSRQCRLCPVQGHGQGHHPGP